MYYNELYHHGRLGQKWGQRNGPPYPLSKTVIGSAYPSRKERKKKQKEEKLKKEAEKRRDAARKEAEKQKEEATIRNERKERALKSSSASEILKYKDDLTSDELRKALDRIKWTNELTSLAAKETDKGWNVINQLMNKLGDVKNWTRTFADLYKTIDEVRELSNKR